MNYAEAHADLEAAIAEEGAAIAAAAEVAPPRHVVVLGGDKYMRDPKGRLVPVETIEAFDLLMDETVRKIARFAEELRDQIARYKQHTLNDVLGLKEILAQEHNVTIGGEKGNITLTTFDGLMKVTLKIADVTVFGPELQAAKAKVSECLRGWSEGATPELRAVVENAFAVDQEGKINRANLLYLLRLNIDNATWKEGMALIRQAERPMGTKEYVQVHVRKSVGDRWEHVAIDVAAA